MNKYVALLPIKEHSERVPGKNFRTFHGQPLWTHIVRTLSKLPYISHIVINTDSTKFTPEILGEFPKVSIHVRPEELRGDFVSTNKLFAWDLEQLEPGQNFFLQTHTTNPLLSAATITAAVAKFESSLAANACDSLFTVTPHFARFYRRDRSAINHDPATLLRTQDLDPVLEENSCLYLFTRHSFAATGARIGASPAMFEMDRLEATDIDDETTWRLAEILATKERPS